MDPAGDAGDTSQFATSSVLTDLTLALLQDSGWYVYTLLLPQFLGMLY